MGVLNYSSQFMGVLDYYGCPELLDLWVSWITVLLSCDYCWIHCPDEGVHDGFLLAQEWYKGSGFLLAQEWYWDKGG